MDSANYFFTKQNLAYVPSASYSHLQYMYGMIKEVVMWGVSVLPRRLQFCTIFNRGCRSMRISDFVVVRY